jgi:hypothetical protein
MSWRCESLQPKLEKAEAYLEEAREAQVAARDLDRILKEGVANVRSLDLTPGLT